VFGQEQAPLGVVSEPRNGPLNQTLFGRNMYQRCKMTLSADGRKLYVYDAAHWQIRVIDFATQTSSTLGGVNLGPLSASPAWNGSPYTKFWFREQSGVLQHYSDVRSMVVDRQGVYLYVVDLQWIRRITLATGDTFLLSGNDQYFAHSTQRIRPASSGALTQTRDSVQASWEIKPNLWKRTTQTEGQLC